MATKAKQTRSKPKEPDGAFEVLKSEPPAPTRAGKWAEILATLEATGEATEFHRIRVFAVKGSASSVASHLRRNFGEKWEFTTREFEYDGTTCGGIWARLKDIPSA